MIRFAHRGLINDENTVSGVMTIFRNTDNLGVVREPDCNVDGIIYNVVSI
jgi:hypothetical protein